MDSTVLRVLLASLLLGSASFGGTAPAWGIPLARGMVWTGSGIGATSLGGVSMAGDGSPMLRMEGCGWYHYRSWLIAGAGYNLAMAFPEDEASLFASRYEIHTSMVWSLGERSAFQIDWFGDAGKKDFYADTAAGAPPALNTANYLGSGVLAAVGTRRGPFGFSLSAGGRWSWWTSVSDGRDLDWTWELSPGVSCGMQKLWPRSDSLTKAWDLVLRVPMEYTANQVDISKVHGRSYEPVSWYVGLRLGLAVVF